MNQYVVIVAFKGRFSNFWNSYRTYIIKDQKPENPGYFLLRIAHLFRVPLPFGMEPPPEAPHNPVKQDETCCRYRRSMFVSPNEVNHRNNLRTPDKV